MTFTSTGRSNPLHFLAAFGTGCLLTLMVYFNGQLAFYGNALFSSWAAHGTGAAVALVLVMVLQRTHKADPAQTRSIPAWAYLGGLSGAATVMLTSVSVNSALALSGTLALGLAGQVLFSLAADRWGLFGLPKRRPDLRDLAALGLIVGGSCIIIVFGRVAA